jgi:hypothetical protein
MRKANQHFNYQKFILVKVPPLITEEKAAGIIIGSLILSVEMDLFRTII